MKTCMSTLRESRSLYSAALRRLADSKKFPTRVFFDRTELTQKRRELFARMSISGVQDKFSLVLRRGKLKLVETGGEYILKPVSAGNVLDRFDEEVPANEHVSMQIAEQIYGVKTATNALIFLNDNELAYITRRFDRKGATKIAQEDFAQLLGTSESDGRNYKYDKSYEEIADGIDRYCAAKTITKEMFFRQLVYCYLIGNGNAHLKNFSVTMTTDGDYMLSPAYDLLNTRLHLPYDTSLALSLLAEDGITKGEETVGVILGSDFQQFGERIGIRPDRVEKIRSQIRWNSEADQLLKKSFLSDAARDEFRRIAVANDEMLGQ